MTSIHVSVSSTGTTPKPRSSSVSYASIVRSDGAAVIHPGPGSPEAGVRSSDSRSRQFSDSPESAAKNAHRKEFAASWVARTGKAPAGVLLTIWMEDSTPPERPQLKYAAPSDTVDSFAREVCGHDGRLGKEHFTEALREAAAQGIAVLVHAFLRRGGDPQAPDANGETALHHAATGGHAEVLYLLGGDSRVVDTPDRHGVFARRKITEWFHAHRRDDSALAALTFFKMKWLDGAALDAAARAGDLDGYVRIVGAQATIGDTEHVWALSEAAARGHLGIVTGLLAKNVQRNFQDEYLKTPVHHAVEGGHAPIVLALAKGDLLVDATDSNGSTALQKAEYYGQSDPDSPWQSVCMLLVAAGERHYKKARISRGLFHDAYVLMDQLPMTVRINTSANAMHFACVVLVDKYAHRGAGRPLADWAAAANAQEAALLRQQQAVLSNWDTHWQPDGENLPLHGYRAPEGPHLALDGRAELLITDLQLRRLADPDPRPALHPSDAIFLRRLFAGVIAEHKLTQKTILMASQYLQRLPLRSELVSRKRPFEGDSALCCVCLMLAQVEAQGPLAPKDAKAWRDRLRMSASELDQTEAMLRRQLEEHPTLPGLGLLAM